MRMAGNILKCLVIAFIIGASSMLAYSDYLYVKLMQSGIIGNSFNIDGCKTVMLVINNVFSVLIVGCGSVIIDNKYKTALKREKQLTTCLKDAFGESIAPYFGVKNLQYDIRIFLPRNEWLFRFLQIIHCKKAKLRFRISNYSEIARKDSTSKLEFEVYPNIEGLVGKSYNSKSIMLDDKLEVTNDQEYHLRPAQLERTQQLKWSITVPICKDVAGKTKVVAIVAYDGCEIINIKDMNDKRLRDNLNAFSIKLYDSIPRLFNNRGD